MRLKDLLDEVEKNEPTDVAHEEKTENVSETTEVNEEDASSTDAEEGYTEEE